MPTAATERGVASRERILEAALALFAAQGFSGTSVAEICRMAGVAKTGLYWHFESKEGLLAAVLERTARAQIEEIGKAVYLAPDPAERLDALMAHMRRLLLEQRELVRLHLTVALERGGRDAVTRGALQRVSRAVRDTLVQGLEDALGRPVPDADRIAHTLLALLDGAVVALSIDPDGTDVDLLVENMRTVFVLLVGHHLNQGGMPEGAARGDLP